MKPTASLKSTKSLIAKRDEIPTILEKHERNSDDFGKTRTKFDDFGIGRPIIQKILNIKSATTSTSIVARVEAGNEPLLSGAVVH